MLVDQAHEQIPRALGVFEPLMGPADNARLAFSLNSGSRRRLSITSSSNIHSLQLCAALPIAVCSREAALAMGKALGIRMGRRVLPHRMTLTECE